MHKVLGVLRIECISIYIYICLYIYAVMLLGRLSCCFIQMYTSDISFGDPTSSCCELSNSYS